MTLNDLRVMIVSADTEAVAALTEHIMTGHEADLTIVDTLEEAKTVAASGAFDIIFVAATLPDGCGLSLIDDEGTSANTAFVVLDDTLDARRVLEAFRLGAVDVFTLPLDIARLSADIQHVAQARQDRRRQETRASRLRKLSSRLIRDRRELKHRVDLICRDLVYAYRRLAEKVSDTTGQGVGSLDETHKGIDSYHPNA